MSVEVSQTLLKQRTSKGIGWSTASKFSRQLIQLAFQLALSRLLLPSEFGLFAMVLVFSSFAELLRNMGLNAAIIQRKEVTASMLDTVFVFNIAVGVSFALLLLLLAPAIGAFYKEPGLASLVRAYALVVVTGSFNAVQEALLQKALDFKRLFYMEVASVGISGVLAVVLALKGYGVWSLVIQYLLMHLIATAILWRTSEWTPRFRFVKADFRSLTRFGTHVFANDLLFFASMNLDKLLIGRMLGATALGIYSRAYFLMLQPVNFTNQVLARVMFPVLSTLQDDMDAFRKMYVRITTLMAFVLFPLILFLMHAAPEIVVVLLGKQWSGAAPVFSIFCIYCLVDVIGLTTYWIYKATGRAEEMFRWTIYRTLVVLVFTLLGMRWGIEGVAWSISLSFLVLVWLPGWLLAFRWIELKLGRMLLSLARPFGCAAIVFAGLTLLRPLLPDIHPLAYLLVAAFSGAGVYVLLSIFFNREALLYLIRMIMKKKKKV